MPQMMPINWMLLFFYFIFIFFLFNIMNYYIFKIEIYNKNFLKNFSSKIFTWKW